MAPNIGVVIRARNEEKWIRHCLESIFSQKGVDPHVVLVDNNSEDRTVQIARSFDRVTVVNIDSYTPGRALNNGIAVDNSEFIALISAHCIPRKDDWLEKLLENFSDDTVAGVYGRQLPMPYSSPRDKSDLMIAFGEERRIQRKDWFFHNANSMIRRSAWEVLGFDESTVSIEDRLWAKAMVELEWTIVYEPQAEVFHYNGLHGTSDKHRARRQVEVIENRRAGSEFVDVLSLTPEQTRVTALVPVSNANLKSTFLEKGLEQTFRVVDESKFVSDFVMIASDGGIVPPNARHLDRTELPVGEDDSLNDLLSVAVRAYEEEAEIPDFYIYLNWDYFSRPNQLIDNLIVLARNKGYDSVFAGQRDFSHYWILDDETASFKEIDSSLSIRSRRSPAFKALYGLGTLSSAPLIRSGQIVGGQVGIFPLEEENWHVRGRDSGSDSEFIVGELTD